MTADGPSANNKWNSVFGTLLRRISVVRGARRALELLEESGNTVLLRQAESELPSMLVHLLCSVQDPVAVAAKMPDISELARGAADHQARSLRLAMDSASLVFMHAVLEDVMLECIRASMEAKPATWSKDWKAEKVPMADIEIKTHEQIVAEILARRLEQLRRQPLIKKLKALISALQPPPEVLSDGEYSYSEARIAEIDAVRHQVVHEDPREIPSIEDDLRYLEATAIRFLGHTAVKYKSFSGRLMWGEPK